MTTAFIWLVVNLPLIRLVLVSSPGVFPQLLGHESNQFLFLIVFYPVALFAALHAAAILVGHGSDGHPLAAIVRRFWPHTLALGVMLASSIAVLDYYETPPDFHLLESEYAAQAVRADRVFSGYLAAQVDREVRARERIEVIQEAHNQPPSLDLNLTDNDAYTRANAVEAAHFMWRLAEPTDMEKEIASNLFARRLHVVQVVIVLSTAWIVLVGVLLVMQPGKPAARDREDVAARSLAVAVLAMTSYAVFRSYNRYEVEMASSVLEGVRGELFTPILALGCGAALLVRFRPQLGTVQQVVGLLGGVITLGALVLVQVNPTSLRGFIGSDAGWGNMFLTLIAALFYSMLIVVGMMLESGPGGAGARES